MRAVYVSTSAFRTRDLAKILTLCAAHDLHALELGSHLAYQQDLLGLVRRYYRRPMTYLIHNYFPPAADPFVLNLAVPPGPERERILAHCRQAIDLCTEFQVPIYSVHAGVAVPVRPEELGRRIEPRQRMDRATAYGGFVEGVRELAAYGRARGIRVLVENHVVTAANLVGGRNELLFCATADDICRFLADVDAPNVGVYLDLGHAKVTGATLGFDPRDFVRDVGFGVEALQLSDNDGVRDENRPFDGSAWFADLLPAFSAATFVIEASGDVEEIRASRILLERMLVG